VRKSITKRALWRRAVALTAAYAIALASLLATFTAARATLDVGNTLGVICHTLDADQSNPAGGHDNGKVCAENCCIGCLMLAAALPPPPVKVSGAPQSGQPILSPPTAAPLAAGIRTKSHRSRAPPLTA
jgi:hypothetical protein